jgi:hypothetical protein
MTVFDGEPLHYWLPTWPTKRETKKGETKRKRDKGKKRTRGKEKKIRNVMNVRSIFPCTTGHG